MERIKNLPMPNGMTRDEIIDLLLQQEYGYLPQASNKTEVARVEMLQDDFCSGKAELLKIVLKCTLENSEFSFPVYYTRLKDCKGEVPCFILINFRSDVCLYVWAYIPPYPVLITGHMRTWGDV